MKDEKLDFWIKNRYNVLIKGAHGIGKTNIVKEAFERNGLNWLYFSAATMDPWVDFIGVPKEATDENGQKYLDLIRPRPFANDEVEALFFDELNRANKKVRNAVMELIQFKSINGKKFNNLKIIWAAVNPDDDDDSEYDVEKLDPAQLDRFHIIVDADNKPNRSYFKKKYGDNGIVAIEWWNSLPKDAISPRRLDYLLDIFNNNGDIDDALPNNVSSVQLISQLKNGSYISQLNNFIDSNDMQGLAAKMNDVNFFSATINHVIDKNHFTNIAKYLPKEDVSNIILTNKNVRSKVLKNNAFIQEHEELLRDITKTKGLNIKIIKEINKVIPKVKLNNNTNNDDPVTSFLLNYYMDIPRSNSSIIKNYNNTYSRKNILQNFNILKQNDFKDVTLEMMYKLMAVISSVRMRTQGQILTSEALIAFNLLKSAITTLGMDEATIFSLASKTKLFISMSNNTSIDKLKNNLAVLGWQI